MTKRLLIDAEFPDSAPRALGRVSVTLVGGSAGAVVGNRVVADPVVVTLDADGHAELDLATNDVEVTEPATSFYRVTLLGSSPTISRALRLTDDLPAEVSWTDPDIAVDDPAIPSPSVSADYVNVPGAGSLTNYLAESASLSLGETSSTAYRGDRGKAAYDHSQAVGNPHGTAVADVSGLPEALATKVPLSAIDAAGDLLVGTADNAVGRLAIGAARKVLTSDGSTASWATAAGPSPAMFPVAVGQWFANPHDAVYAQATTLNRVLYVPMWVPADVSAVDGIQIEVTTVGAAGAVVRLGLHAPHATTKFPDARMIDGGTVDATSGGGAAGVRSLTITPTAVTPNSLVYVSVVSQGAIATLRYANSGIWLLAMGVPSATNTDVMRTTSGHGWFEPGVAGGFGATASPTYSTSTVAQVLVGLRRA